MGAMQCSPRVSGFRKSFVTGDLSLEGLSLSGWEGSVY